MVFDGFKGMGVWLSMRGPSRHNMLGLSWAMHVHVLRNVHCIDRSKFVMSCGWLCWLLAFTRA
jgi:hypothetical protein